MFQNARIISTDTDDRDYHANKASVQRGSPEYRVSPSTLKEFDKCASRWLRGYNPPESDAKDYGKLLDTLVLTPNEFERRYAVRPEEKGEDGTLKPLHANTTKFKEWAKTQAGKELILSKEHVGANAAEFSLFADSAVRKFIESSEKQVLVVGEWKDRQTDLVIPVCCLIDLVPNSSSEFSECLGDLKTSRNASKRGFEAWTLHAGYHVQAAFDLGLYNAASGEDRSTWCFLISENFPPYQPSKKMLSQEFLDIGRGEVFRMLHNYAVCLKTGEWPDYDTERDKNGRLVRQGWGIVEAPAWAANQSAYAPRFELLEEAEDEMPPESIAC